MRGENEGGTGIVSRNRFLRNDNAGVTVFQKKSGMLKKMALVKTISF
jgi:hypothetical protein